MVEKILGRWPHLLPALEAAWGRFETLFPSVAEVLRFAWNVLRKFNKDDCLSYASGLAFWLTVSLVPLATLLFKMLALVLGSKAYGPGTLRTLESLVPYLPEDFLDDIVGNSKKLGGVGLSWGVLLFGAYWGISQLDSTLAHVFGLRIRKHRQTRKNLLVRQLGILVGGLLVLVTFLVLLVGGELRTILPVRQTHLLPYLPPLLGLLVVTTVLQHLPRVHVRFRHAFLGACVSTTLWWIAKGIFGIYLRHTMTWGIMYGSLIGIVAGLTFLYYSCAIFLLGAEVTAAFYRHDTGSISVPAWVRMKALEAHPDETHPHR
jgi:membrane protein